MVEFPKFMPRGTFRPKKAEDNTVIAGSTNTTTTTTTEPAKANPNQEPDKKGANQEFVKFMPRTTFRVKKESDANVDNPVRDDPENSGKPE